MWDFGSKILKILPFFLEYSYEKEPTETNPFLFVSFFLFWCLFSSQPFGKFCSLKKTILGNVLAKRVSYLWKSSICPDQLSIVIMGSCHSRWKPWFPKIFCFVRYRAFSSRVGLSRTNSQYLSGRPFLPNFDRRFHC